MGPVALVLFVQHVCVLFVIAVIAYGLIEAAPLDGRLKKAAQVAVILACMCALLLEVTRPAPAASSDLTIPPPRTRVVP